MRKVAPGMALAATIGGFGNMGPTHALCAFHTVAKQMVVHNILEAMATDRNALLQLTVVSQSS